MDETYQINGTIVGYDPGGNDKNGLAILRIEKSKPVDIRIETAKNSEAVICKILKNENIIGLGVDTLSCWGTGNSGWRPADTWLRNKYPDVRNSVMTPNYLSGAMGINGMSVLIEVAKNLDGIFLSETHPKVLYHCLTQKIYAYTNDSEAMDSFMSGKLGIKIKTSNDHEWDAVISAYALLMGVTGTWKLDLHKLQIRENERIIKPCGKTYYYWPAELKSKPLPYTMGNGGDLIKHGLLAEFINWHCRTTSERLAFYDPFGGRPWQELIHEIVAKRIKKLDPCPLKSAQQDCIQGYYGSGHLVAQISAANDNKVSIYSSDKDADARCDLANTGLEVISLAGFDHNDGYSIIDCEFSDTEDALILIDPFYDLANINKNVLEKIIQKVTNGKISIALYVLYADSDSEIEHWNNFKKMQNSLTAAGSVSYVSLKCKTIGNSPISGESNYHSYISLYTHKYYSEQDLVELHKAVEDFSINLAGAIGCQIKYQSRINT
ncbi:MAG: hypothetical protein ACYC56_05630 [Candidatus Aquicultor sp.]